MLERIKAQIVLTILMEENIEYFQNTYYDLEIDHGDAEIIDTDNLFEQVSIQLFCIKLVHNISMMNEFYINYSAREGANLISNDYKNKNLFLRFNITPNNVDIVKRSGFGLFGYNVDDMANAIGKFSKAMKEYLEELSEEDDFEFLKHIIKNFDIILQKPDDALINFILKNKKFFKKQYDEAENISKES